MKHIALLCLISVSLIVPAGAKDVTDIVRTNCTREIISSTDVTRDQVKTFPVRKSGSGYEMSGQNSNGQSVVCTADADGNPKWVKVG